MTRRLAAGVALVLLVGVLVWSVGGGAPTERVTHGDEASESAREGDEPVTFASAVHLAAAERVVESRVSLDDRRAWSATLAFAPDMAWLAPQLVWRVRAAGGDSDDVLEPLAPLPPDGDGDGTIELSLRVPVVDTGERVVLDLHLGDGSEFLLASFDLHPDEVPNSEASFAIVQRSSRISVAWSDLPLLAAGVVKSHGANGVTIGCRIRPGQTTTSFAALQSAHVVARTMMRIARGKAGDFALFASPLPSVDGAGHAATLWLQSGNRPFSNGLPVTVGRTDVVLEVDRGDVRVELALDPSVEYPGMVLRIDDASGATVESERIEGLRARAAETGGLVVVETRVVAGTAVYGLADDFFGGEPIERAAPAPLLFSVARGATVDPTAGVPFVVLAQPDVAQLKLTADSAAHVRATWIRADTISPAFMLTPPKDAVGGEIVERSLALLVPRDAQRIAIESAGHRCVELDAWRASSRAVTLEPIAPARITVDWSKSDVVGVNGHIAIEFWRHRDPSRPLGAAEPDELEPVERSDFEVVFGSNESFDVVLHDVVEIAHVFVRWRALVDDPVTNHVRTSTAILRVHDITSAGTSCFAWNEHDRTRRLRLESGRDFVVHLGETIEPVRER